MTPKAFQLSTIRMMVRPAEYEQEMRDCSTGASDDGAILHFDADLPCYVTLVAKYRTYKPTQDDVARAAAWQKKQGVNVRVLFMVKDGPPLWREFHSRPFQVAGLSGEREWIEAFKGRIPCGICRDHFNAILLRMPPDLSSIDSYFAWGVAVHNKVSQAIGKAQMAVVDARKLYDPSMRSAA